jgi:hypothetical protein
MCGHYGEWRLEMSRTAQRLEPKLIVSMDQREQRRPPGTVERCREACAEIVRELAGLEEEEPLSVFVDGKEALDRLEGTLRIGVRIGAVGEVAREEVEIVEGQLEQLGRRLGRALAAEGVSARVWTRESTAVGACEDAA